MSGHRPLQSFLSTQQQADERVAAYLSSPPGCSTPLDLQRRLFGVDWRAWGVASGVPSWVEVHRARHLLAIAHLDQAREDWRSLRDTLRKVRPNAVSSSEAAS